MHEQFATAHIDPRHVFIDPADQPQAAAEQIITALAAGDLAYAAC